LGGLKPPLHMRANRAHAVRPYRGSHSIFAPACAFYVHCAPSCSKLLAMMGDPGGSPYNWRNVFVTFALFAFFVFQILASVL
jgi:hypothetical protein